MPFLDMTKAPRVVPGVGPPHAHIAIVGEAPGAYEDIALKPFVGPAGSVLEQCLHSAGLIRGEVYLTNVVKVKPKANDIAPFFNSKTGIFTPLGLEWVAKLQDELNELNPNIIIACGATAFAALCGQHRILKFRGYIFESKGLARVFKVLPCLHPAAALRGNYIYRHLIASDLRKARDHSATVELTRPARQLVFEFGSVQEVLEWLAYFEKQPILSVDIEVTNFEVSCIGLSSSPMLAASIPLDGRWSEMEELQIWRGLQRVLANPFSIKVLQNGVFDIQFLLTKYGLEVKGPIRDTMIAHSVMYPELLKGLAFLGSLYCGTQEYWKDMVRFDDIKDNS